MTVDEIIKQVRFCIDEESNNTSSLADVIDEKDDSYMDNIIKAKIPDALHWIAVTATSSAVLSNSKDASLQKTDSPTSSAPTDMKVKVPEGSDTISTDMEVKAFEGSDTIGIVEMPNNISVFNINRVRATGWHKAVVPVEDTSDDALLMFDETAMGTIDRPQAAIMRTTPLKLLVQPKAATITVSYVGVPTVISKDNDEQESVDISDNFKSSFIYYLAFLLLSAYDDSKANQMYNIALQMLGVNQSK
jgi:hypothetical protein